MTSRPKLVARTGRVTLLLVLAATVLAAAASGAGAAGCVGTACKDRVGLRSAYTYNSGCTAGPIDPINVLWFGSGSGASIGPVGQDMSDIGWTFNDNQQVNLGPFGFANPFPVDHQQVREFRTAPEGNLPSCVGDATQRATGFLLASDRNHVRLFPTAAPAGTPSYVVGDAHHDHTVNGNFNCVSLSIIPSKHKASDFNGPRNAIAGAFMARGAFAHFDNWENGRQLQQCDGTYVGSDGQVAVLRAFPG